MGQPVQIPPQTSQQIVVQAIAESKQNGQQKLDALQFQRQLHRLSEQTAEKAAGLLRLFVAQRVDCAVHRYLAAVD